MNPRSWIGVFAVLAVAPRAHAAVVDLAGAEASSTYSSVESTMSYDAKRVDDGKLSTAWVEGKEGSGLGEWIQLDLGGERTVQQVKVWGGMWFSRTQWERSNRPKEIRVEFSDGSTEDLTLADEMKPAVLTLKSPKKTTSVTLKIVSVYPGTAWLDTPISEVQVVDDEPPKTAPVEGVHASSTMSADADGSYDAKNVLDGLSDSMWCEGTDGDGTGESLDFEFGHMQKVSTLDLIDGNATNLSFWFKSNRATAATLTFSDGGTAPITLHATMLPQDVTFPAHLTSSVKLTFTEVAKGKEYNDLCVSEASFR